MLLCMFISFSLLWNFPLIQSIATNCPIAYSSGNQSDLCYYHEKKASTWLDAYHQCLTRTLDGTLIEIFTIEQFNQLKTINIDASTMFWLGANNIGASPDSEWHWLDGSIVNGHVIQWCSNNTYETAIGAYCAAYDSQAHCITNHLCHKLLPAPCVSATNNRPLGSKAARLASRQTVSGLCASTSGNNYGNWWTYSVLLLNWFILFCFYLYLCNHFLIDKNTLIITSIFALLSFIMIVIFAILWGVQYQNIIQIPLAVVILGSIACVILILDLLIILLKRTLVRRWMACTVVVALVLIIESFLMLGLILCTAYCSGYITLAPTSLDKDVIASLLASLTTAVSILGYTALLNLFDNGVPDRVQPMKPAPPPSPAPAPAPPRSSAAPPVGLVSVPSPQPLTVRQSQTNVQRASSIAPGNKAILIERATSPVDERVLEEFYSDAPKDIHAYNLGGRKYVVYEGKHHAEDIETYRKDLVQAMLLQEPDELQQSIMRAKTSIHAIALRDEINQAETLATKIG